ncbi:MAG: 2-thiouracil desulfurase family protein [Rubrivivax sp.]
MTEGRAAHGAGFCPAQTIAVASRRFEAPLVQPAGETADPPASTESTHGNMNALDARTAKLASRLADERSRRIVLVSHCLLNQNVRYLGGAACPGVVTAAIDPLVREGCGLYQMPCPEQAAWGGVSKRFVLLAYGSRRHLSGPLLQVLLALFRGCTRWRYRRLARRVADHVADYRRCGYAVEQVVGVGDSPSCGVDHTLDLRRSLGVVAAIDIETIDRATFNRQAVHACIVPGQGLYMQALRREFERRGLQIPFREHWPGEPPQAQPLCSPFSSGQSRM